MDAKKARQQAEEFNNSGINKQYQIIKGFIINAAERGGFETWIHETITVANQQLLKTEGYEVTDCSDDIRNEPGFKITW